MLQGYAPLEGTWDEMLDKEGKQRDFTHRFTDALARLSKEDFAHRWDAAQRQIRENGVTYNVYDDAQGSERPWVLDPLPLLVPEDDWASLERGLAQRAHLLNLVLQDVYGTQSLLRGHVLPPEVIFANPAFLRPAYGALRTGARHLHIYAADVARDPTGQYWVIGDRTQAPSGMGYALENRVVLSRALSRVYRDCRVQRLAPFFNKLIETLRDLSPRKQENPTAVLLSPGPLNETYFEHAYLARYLGLTLVGGADLTVRNDVVYLKTLGGLERVDVILRRVDDDFCDPLSLRGDSTLGVAGLVNAIHAGNVAVVNSLGTGVAESPALLPFLHAASRHLLGEDLILPSGATYWCGQPGPLSHVLEHLDELIIKPAFPGLGQPEPIFPRTLTKAQKAALIARIKSDPYAYVGQERLHLPTAPTYRDEQVIPQHVATRAYLVGSGPGYHAMRGGLTRVSTDQAYPVLSMQRGAGSKDTWILAEGAVNPLTLLGRQATSVELTRGGSDLPSRVADHLYWLGRYMERAECTVRLCRSLLSRVVDDSGSSDSRELAALIEALRVHTEGQIGLSYVPDEAGVLRLEHDLLEFIIHSDSPYGIRASLNFAHQNASAVRDRMSIDAFRATSRLHGDCRALAARKGVTAADVLAHLDNLVLFFGSFAGMSVESLSRTFGYRFLLMGRRVERALAVARLLISTLTEPDHEEQPVLLAVLEVLDNAMTYRRRYQGIVQPAPVIDLLVTDEINPRSIAFQLRDLHEHIEALPRAQERPYRTDEERIVLRMLTQTRLADVGALASTDSRGKRAALREHLADTIASLPDLSNMLTRSYLSHAQPKQSSVST